jgi:CheY-like chemotaxis protein
VTTIAVVDDDQSLLDLMSELLRERNWTMIALRDGYHAGEVVRSSAPDAILLDIRLDSEISGWDVLDELLAEPATRSIPVIIWSADAKTLDARRERLRQAGVRVLAKPFEIDELFRLLDAALPVAGEALEPPTNCSA